MLPSAGTEKDQLMLWSGYQTSQEILSSSLQKCVSEKWEKAGAIRRMVEWTLEWKFEWSGNLARFPISPNKVRSRLSEWFLYWNLPILRVFVVNLGVDLEAVWKIVQGSFIFWYLLFTTGFSNVIWLWNYTRGWCKTLGSHSPLDACSFCSMVFHVAWLLFCM